ncbi:Pre-mRNA-splicing factor 18 [Tyrophagus putrescentiae]|nr:Pre-mRNA-splicing factor 18 [Tyrophagus putrescentiae]
MNTTIEEIIQEAQYLGRHRGKEKEKEKEKEEEETGAVNSADEVEPVVNKSDSLVILKFLKFLLELWGKKLNDRSEPEKRSTQGKIATAIYTQTQNYLKPLFKTLQKETESDFFSAIR